MSFLSDGRPYFAGAVVPQSFSALSFAATLAHLTMHALEVGHTDFIGTNQQKSHKMSFYLSRFIAERSLLMTTLRHTFVRLVSAYAINPSEDTHRTVLYVAQNDIQSQFPHQNQQLQMPYAILPLGISII